MRRGVRDSVKRTQNYNEYSQSQQPDTNFKGFQEKTCSNSRRNKLKESNDEHEVDEALGYARNGDGNMPQKKFNKLYSKTVLQLEKVKAITEVKTNETENVADLRRQLQRADEFSIRFSRNNLYEAKRIINEVKNLLIPYPYENLGHYKVLWKKMILAFQASSQALQTYINYAKNPANLEIPEKVHELVLVIADLFLCYEQLIHPTNNVHVRNDAVKICNELINVLKTKIPVSYYVEFKELDLMKNKNKQKANDELSKMKNFSMYKKKLTLKTKTELPKKKSHSFLNLKPRKLKPEGLRMAKLTHDIYTQKLNCPLESTRNKSVKFKSQSHEHMENHEEKKGLKKHKFTPREVKSQDDDVETVVQTIGDDEVSTGQFSSYTSRADGDFPISKSSFKNLLLETIAGLQNADGNEGTENLTKFLKSIQNYAPSPRSERVKVYHMYSQDILEEKECAKKTDEEKESQTDKIDGSGDPIQPSPGATTPERRLKNPFRVKNAEFSSGEGASKRKIQLKLSEETMSNATKYRKAFAEFRRNNIMYKKTLANKPWELVGRVSDSLILDLIKEITTELQDDALLKRLYFSELQEVMS